MSNPMNILINSAKMHNKYEYLVEKINELPSEVYRYQLIDIGINPKDVKSVADAFMIDLID